jgi:HNH endonuclease
MPIPTESKIYPSHFEIPYYSAYVVNKDGTSVIRKEDGTQRNAYVAYNGYKNYSLRKDGSKRTCIIGTHRLVCLAFHPLPPQVALEDITVNHKNGNKKDNSPDNLEWMTLEANISHAWDNGLTKKELRPVVVRNERAGDEITYRSYNEAEKSNGLENRTLRGRMLDGPDRVWPGYFRYALAGHKFRPLTADEIEKSINGYIENSDRKVFTLNVLTDVETEYATVADCAKAQGIKYITVSRIRLTGGPDKVWYEGYRYRCENEVFTKESRGDSSLLTYSEKQPVNVRWLDTKDVIEYAQMIDVVKATGVGYAYLAEYMSIPGQCLFYGRHGCFQLQYKYKPQPWREIKDPCHELTLTKLAKEIILFDESWKLVKVFSGMYACAKTEHMSELTVRSLLDSKGQTVHEGKRFMRYLDYLRMKGQPEHLIC